MIEHNPSLQQNTKEDAGLKAKDKLNEKNKSGVLKRRVKQIFSLAIALILITSGVVYNQRIETTETYIRECKLPKESPIKVTGKRIYRNDVTKIAGFVIKKDNSSEQRTLLNVGNEDLLVTTVLKDKWGTEHFPAGDVKTIDLYESDFYVFNQGKDTWVVNYREFCRTTN